MMNAVCVMCFYELLFLLKDVEYYLIMGMLSEHNFLVLAANRFHIGFFRAFLQARYF